MRREVLQSDLEKLYTANDMVKAGCNGCAGCSDCCRGMGVSVVLDPLDVYRMCQGLKTDFNGLMKHGVELNPVDGLILPNLKMTGSEECCTFLNEEGRCSIHAFRPGVCRLFPLGRYYKDGTFRYFLQQQECRMQPRTKVKISKWIDTPELKKYEAYVLDWHNFQEEAQELLKQQNDDQLTKDFNMHLLQTFFITAWGHEDFYAQFAGRMSQMRRLMKILAKTS
ncbi:MAG: YkgJ family cysteine cluster protein [Eubacteriales bacterium]|nr:YkgJ family cysteine cluster protein [Eubacteriales bacterium]